MPESNSGDIDLNGSNPDIVDPDIDETDESPPDPRDSEPTEIEMSPGAGSGTSDTLPPIEETRPAESVPTSPTDEPPEGRYPTRERRAPHRYDPSNSGTFNFLVI